MFDCHRVVYHVPSQTVLWTCSAIHKFRYCWAKYSTFTVICIVIQLYESKLCYYFVTIILFALRMIIQVDTIKKSGIHQYQIITCVKQMHWELTRCMYNRLDKYRILALWFLHPCNEIVRFHVCLIYAAVFPWRAVVYIKP